MAPPLFDCEVYLCTAVATAATEPEAIFCLLERRARKENFYASVKLLLRNSIVSLFFLRVYIASVSLVFNSVMTVI